MAFSKTPSIRSNNQRNMEERWHLQPQRTIEKNLLGRGRKKIVPAVFSSRRLSKKIKYRKTKLIP